jgi:hypothetical protein
LLLLFFILSLHGQHMFLPLEQPITTHTQASQLARCLCPIRGQALKHLSQVYPRPNEQSLLTSSSHPCLFISRLHLPRLLPWPPVYIVIAIIIIIIVIIIISIVAAIRHKAIFI